MNKAKSLRHAIEACELAIESLTRGAVAPEESQALAAIRKQLADKAELVARQRENEWKRREAEEQARRIAALPKPDIRPVRPIVGEARLRKTVAETN